MSASILRASLVLGLMNLVIPFAIDMYVPALPAISDDLGVPVSATQLTLLAFFVTFGVGQLLYGPIADMFGRKRPLYFGLVLYGLASLGCAFSTSIEMLIALRVLQGAGAAAVASIPRAIVRDQFTGNAATRVMATIMLVTSVAPMLAPLAGVLLIVPFGWRSVFFALAIASLVSLSLAVTSIPETLPRDRRMAIDLVPMFRAFGRLLRDRTFLGLVTIAGTSMAAFFAFLSAAPFLYQNHYGLDAVQFSIFFAMNALGFFGASQFAGPLGERFGPARVMHMAIIGFVVFAALLFAVAALTDIHLYVLVAMLFPIFACHGLIVPTAMMLSLENHGTIAGMAAALGGTLQMLLGTISIIIMSMVFDGRPLALVITLLVCALLAFAISAAIARSIRMATDA